MKHIRWLLLGAILAVCSGHPVHAQSTNLPVNGVATWCWDGTNWVGCEPSGGGGGSGTPGGAADSIQYNATGGNFGGVALSSAQIVIGQTVGAPLAEGISGDGGMTNLGVLTITKTNGTAFGALATVTPGTGVAAAIANAVNTAGGLGTIGTSGGTVGLLNGNLTFSGNDIFSGLLTFSGLSSGTQVVCLGLTSGNALVTSAGACGSGGGGGLTINSTLISGGSASHFLFDDGTKLQEAAPGVGLVFNGSTLNTTAPVETAQTASFSVASTDMGKTTPVNISGGGTITLPLSGAFSTVFGSGQTWCGINTGATADTVTNSTGGTMTPSITSLASGAQLCLQSDGAALYATYTLGAYSGSGTVTTSGSPASGNLAKFSGSTAITNTDLTGDVTTSGGVATTVASHRRYPWVIYFRQHHR